MTVGLIWDNDAGAINPGARPLRIASDDGLVIANASGTNTATLTASSAGLAIANNIDLSNNQALNFCVENTMTPAAGHPGRLIIDGIALKYDDGSTFQVVATVSGSSSAFSGDVSSTTQGYLSDGLGTPLLIRDDGGITIADSANVNSVNLAVLAPSVLTFDGSLVSTGVQITGASSGAIPYFDASAQMVTNVTGTSSQVLIGGTTPSFGSVTSSMVDSSIIVAAGTNVFTGTQGFGGNNITGVNTLSTDVVQANTTNGNLTIQPNGSGTQVNIASGKTLTADTISSTTGSSDLTLMATGTNIVIASGKTFKTDSVDSASGSGSIAFNGNLLSNIADPVNPQDVASKNYVDSLKNGIQWKQSVRLATDGALPTYTAAGASVGKTLTANANGFLTIDGVAAVFNDRILVKDGATNTDNGIYVVTDTGSSGSPWILTRSTDADENSEVLAGMAVFSDEGTANSDAGWVLTTPDPITLDTTGLTFVQFASLSNGTPVAGDGITISGATVSVRADSNSGISSLIVNSGSAPNGISINFDPSGALTATSSGTTVLVDNSTIDIFSNALEVKDLGITTGKLADGVLSADSAGRAKIAPGFFDETTIGDIFSGVISIAEVHTDLILPQSSGDTIVSQSDGGVALQNAIGVEGYRTRVLSVTTTDATVTEITVDGTSLLLANNTVHGYVVYITARCTGGTGGHTNQGAMFKIEVAANAASGTASLIGTPLTTTIANSQPGVWTVSTAVTSNKIIFQVTGAANDDVTWTGFVQETVIQ